jgi:melibiose permease
MAKVKKPGVTVLETATYSIGSLGREVSNNCVNVFFLAFLNIYMGLDAIILTVAFVVAKLWDAVNDPLLATLVNNSKRGKWGRFRPWIWLGALLNCLSLIGMFYPIGFATQLPRYVYYIGLYIVWGMTFTLMDVPFWSMLPTIADSTGDRNKVSSLSKLIGGFGGFVISSIGTSLIIPKVAASSGATWAHFALACTAAAMVFCFVSVTVLGNKEKYDLPESKISLRDIFGLFKTNDQLGAYASSYVLFVTAATISLFQILYIFIYYGDMGGLGWLSQGLGYTIFTAVACTGQGIAMIFYQGIVKKIPRERIYGANYFMAIAGMIGMFFIFFALRPEYPGVANGTAKWINVIVVALAGAFLMTSNGLNQIGSTVMIADVADYGEWKTGRRSDSILFSVQTLLLKLAGAVAMLILGIGIKVAKLPSVTQRFNEETGAFDYEFIGNGGEGLSTGALNILRVFMFLVPIPLCIWGWWIYKKKYWLHGEKYDKIKQEIDARRK